MSEKILVGPELARRAERLSHPPLPVSTHRPLFLCLCSREHSTPSGEEVVECKCGRRWTYKENSNA